MLCKPIPKYYTKLIFVPTMVTIVNCQCFVNQYLIYEADFCIHYGNN